MKIVNGFIIPTWKEDIELMGANNAPRWKRVLAPLQHWFACKLFGHTPCDLRREWPSEPIGRTAPPEVSLMDLRRRPPKIDEYKDALAAKKRLHS